MNNVVLFICRVKLRRPFLHVLKIIYSTAAMGKWIFEKR